VTTSLADAVDYATQNASRRRPDAKKPIKNSDLAGSANTCIGITRQHVARTIRRAAIARGVRCASSRPDIRD
jgi:hypothetical protein